MYLQDQVEKKSLGGASEVRNILEEVPISTLEHTVMKLYLEDFYQFCLTLPAETAAVRVAFPSLPLSITNPSSPASLRVVLCWREFVLCCGSMFWLDPVCCCAC